ncbi:hypothetical protein PITC_070970 [Penicillium italicum]|uniref:Uncharacterized protein n=1 Tax=Penicillium italicum TaxID=40296 RepID=A0A0A2KKX3_PENIT|nr:hypothetical protein PITC_070970 [Penicillium italicum]
MGFFDRPTHTTFIFDSDHKNCLKYGSDYALRSTLIELFLAEQALRELTQREEWLHHKVLALQKAMAIASDGKSDMTQFENAKKSLEETQVQYPKREYALYLAECRFHLKLKDAYDSLRHDTKWFMREEMVQDCSDRGGCCSRKCGCCEQRHLSRRTKGRGHCTIECECCIGFRGFELLEKQKQEMSNEFETMLKEYNSAYTIHLANCFFCPLKLKPQLSRWERTFKKGTTPEKD